MFVNNLHSEPSGIINFDFDGKPFEIKITTKLKIELKVSGESVIGVNFPETMISFLKGRYRIDNNDLQSLNKILNTMTKSIIK